MPIGGSGKVQRGLGGDAGFGEVQLPRSDDGSYLLDVSSVFRSGLRYFDNYLASPSIYVNTNGTISFHQPFSGYCTADLSVPDQPVIAPFWADVDTRLDGEGSESGAIWADLDSNNGVLTITWNQVGAYRRNAEVSNLFQVQLYASDNAGVSIAFRYENIEWEIGTAPDDIGAMAGIFDGKEGGVIINDTSLLTLEDEPGNTGIQGFWAYLVTDTGPEDIVLKGDVISGSAEIDHLQGTIGNDRLLGFGGDDTLEGSSGEDTLIAGAGDDFVFGGPMSADLRDVAFGGGGNDHISGGGGNDALHGQNGHDTLIGGPGADTLIGHAGSDILTGSDLSDILFGGPGHDFLNGGMGSDQLIGGAGADRFFHHGSAHHGSDWVQDYSVADGDVLVFGAGAGYTDERDFLVQFAANPLSGDVDVAEAFITHIPTRQIIWVLVDGFELTSINLQISGGTFDLLAGN